MPQNVQQRTRDGAGRALQRRWPQIVATSLGFGVVQLDVSVVNVAIEPIGRSLGGGTSALQWVVNAYTVVLAAMILTAGALGDRIGARRVFVSGFVVFCVASAACALAPTVGVLVAARAVQGVGAAALVPCSLALLNHGFPDDRERMRAVGLWAAGASVALSGGPLVGGVLTEALGWRAIFVINVPLGLIAIWLTLRHVEETPRDPDRGVDAVGQLAAVTTLAALAAATIEGGVRGFSDPPVLAGFAIAVVAGVGFVVAERRGSRPMLPLELFRSATFSGASAIGLLINVAFYGLIFVLSLWFQQQRGFTALQTGLAFAPSTVAVLAGNLLAGRIAERTGPSSVLAAGSLLITAGLAGLLLIGTSTPYAAIALQLTVIGLGLGLIVPVMTSSLLAGVDPAMSGIAGGTLNTARQTGSVVGVALFGALTTTDLVGGLHTAILIAIGLALATALLTLPIRRSTT